jgi:hypothetical protein
MMAGVAAAADERYTPTQIIPVPGGLTSFDISFVDPAIDAFALADRTNKAIDLIDTRSKTLIQHPASPPFAGNVASPANASGPNGVIIVDHREIWAADGPLFGGCVSSPAGLKCSGPLLAQSSVKVIDLKTGITTSSKMADKGELTSSAQTRGGAWCWSQTMTRWIAFSRLSPRRLTLSWGRSGWTAQTLMGPPLSLTV